MSDSAIIGGSGFKQLAGFKVERCETVKTPFGAPSAALVFCSLAARQLVFLPRHGLEHTIAPHRINYRANIHALKASGVKRIVALAAVGGISADISPGSIVLPDQIIDYTWGRAHTFFDERDKGVKHIEFSHPYSENVRAEIIAAAKNAGVQVVNGAVYAVTQGPRFETAAEINRLKRDGADIVGMTAMPEAALARELGIQYAAIAMVVNPAAGCGESIDMKMIAKHLKTSSEKAISIIKHW